MPNPRGEHHHNSKLTQEHVDEIRRPDQTASDYALAERFGVDRTLVRQVRLNAIWRDEEYTPREVRRGRKPQPKDDPKDQPKQDKTHPAKHERETKEAAL